MIRLVLTLLALTTSPLAARQGRIVETALSGDALANRTGDPGTRSALVYLPPDHDDSADLRYPTVYLLHAFGAANRTWLGGEGSYEGLNIAAALDSLIAAGTVTSMIVVMPDALTRIGGSWYVDSPTSGEWATHIASDLVSHIDSTFRTIAEPAARGIAGQSMGAYGALSIAIEQPGVFGAVFAMSPVHVVEPNPLGDAFAARALSAGPQELSSVAVPVRVLWSKALAFSPDTATPHGARLPWRSAGERIERVDSIWRRWVEATLIERVHTATAALRGISIRIEVGDRDALVHESRALSDAMRAEGIAHELHVFDGGHVEGVKRRVEMSMLPFLSRNLGATGRPR